MKLKPLYSKKYTKKDKTVVTKSAVIMSLRVKNIIYQLENKPHKEKKQFIKEDE